MEENGEIFVGKEKLRKLQESDSPLGFLFEIMSVERRRTHFNIIYPSIVYIRKS